MSDSIYLQFLSYDEHNEVLITVHKIGGYICVREEIIYDDRVGWITQNTYTIDE